MVRKGDYYKLKPAIDEELDKKVNELSKKADLIKKIQKVMNTIKANGLYSEKEMHTDMRKLEQSNAPEAEKELLFECWHVRKKINEELIHETKQVIDDIKRAYKKGA